jgi:hypothetical protein
LTHPRYLLDALGVPAAELLGVDPDTGLAVYRDLPDPDRPDLVVHEDEVGPADREWWVEMLALLEAPAEACCC